MKQLTLQDMLTHKMYETTLQIIAQQERGRRADFGNQHDQGLDIINEQAHGIQLPRTTSYTRLKYKSQGTDAIFIYTLLQLCQTTATRIISTQNYRKYQQFKRQRQHSSCILYFNKQKLLQYCCSVQTQTVVT